MQYMGPREADPACALYWEHNIQQFLIITSSVRAFIAKSHASPTDSMDHLVLSLQGCSERLNNKKHNKLSLLKYATIICKQHNSLACVCIIVSTLILS